MCGSSPKAPKPPPILPEAPILPEVSDSLSGKDKDKLRKRAAAGEVGTLLTGGRGLETEANTSQKVLLGE